MPYCAYPGCKNSSNPKRKSEKQLKAEKCKGKKLSFHSFPKDSCLRKKWSARIGLAECYITKTATICSDHFLDDDYKINVNRRILNETAVPFNTLGNISPQSIVIPSTPCEVEEVEVEENVQQIPVQISTLENISESIVIASTSCETEEVKVKESVQQIPLHIVTANTSCEAGEVEIEENAQEIPVHIMTATPSRKRKRDAFTSITPSRLFNSPIKKRMREIHTQEVAHLRRQLQCVQQKVKRCIKRIQSLGVVLRDMGKKNMLSSDAIDSITHLSPWDECG